MCIRDRIKTKRHPTLEDHVVVGAGAQILGPILIGAHSRIGSNAVVVKDVPPGSVVVGVPGRARPRSAVQAPLPSPTLPSIGHEDMDLHHNITPDITMEMLAELSARLRAVEQELATQHQEQWEGMLDGEDSYAAHI